MTLLRFEIRGAAREDVDGLLRVARHLDSVNLPHDRDAITAIIEKSEASFAGAIVDPWQREYVFVVHDREDDRVVGTSKIVAQLGRRDAPYIYFDVRTEERYSRTLDRHFCHTVLRMAYSYDGPTEIGGLVVDPAYRAAHARVGTMISFVRFLFVAAHRNLFRDQLLAELMPPLRADGTSCLWEAVGRRFTGLDYRTADRLSRENKEFIRGLFPDGDVYATLLSEDARAVIGQVGDATRGVELLLRRIGFEYAHRIDPFDGGPHFVASSDQVLPIRHARFHEVRGSEVGTAHEHIMLVRHDGPPWVRAVVAPVRRGDDGRPTEVPSAVLDHLGISTGEHLWETPLRYPKAGPGVQHL